LGSDGSAISFRQNPTATLAAGTERVRIDLTNGRLGVGVSPSYTLDVAGASRLGAAGTSFTRIRHGTATLVSGTVDVSDANTTANTEIFVNRFTDGGTVSCSYSVTRVATTKFTITGKNSAGSTNTSDTSVVAWYAIEP
jgi:hypothetical protein